MGGRGFNAKAQRREEISRFSLRRRVFAFFLVYPAKFLYVNQSFSAIIFRENQLIYRWKMHPVHASSFSQPVQTIQHRSVQHAATESGCCGRVRSILERIANAFRSAFRWVQSLFCGSSRSSEAPSSATPRSTSSQERTAPLSPSRVTSPPTLPEATAASSITPPSTSPQPAPLSPSRVTSPPALPEATAAPSVTAQPNSFQEGEAPLSQSQATAGPIERHVRFPEGLASGSHNPPDAFRRSRGAIPAEMVEVMAAERTQISLAYLRSIAPDHPLIQNRDQQCLDFYRGTGCDANGRTLRQILAWDDRQLESVHDYIQWLFPNYRPSEINSQAPLLNETIVQAFHREPVLRDNLIVSFLRMLRFYGLEESGLHEFRRAPNAAQRQAVWLTPDNHNYKRITRILICLRVTMGPGFAQRFLRILEDIAQKEGRRSISRETLQIWRFAAGLPR